MPTLMLDLASASPPHLLQCLACLRARTPHLHLHHSLRFHTPASSLPWLSILMLLRDPQVMPPMPPHLPNLICRLPPLCSWSAFPTCLRCCGIPYH
ncbi:hypothetical protein O181_086306 [Austropuccinia psidii MF-1]|uniref:Uncharacterized protein n=1 Tax=Austropuccinia psidii MF-1 TaxID=1389203 RepID=A0A9Q3FZV0_9BASI|nr:hypothetical protein [Austropuccinia psidii MF-1]